MMKEFIFQFWPQLFILVVYLTTIYRGWLFAGEWRDVKITLLRKLQVIVSITIQIWVLSVGGWFHHIGAAQIIWLILYCITVPLAIIGLFALDNNETITNKINNNWISIFLSGLIYYWGGFFDAMIYYIQNT